MSIIPALNLNFIFLTFCLAQVIGVITNLQAMRLFEIVYTRQHFHFEVVSYPQLKWCALQISSEARCMKFSEERTEYAYYYTISHTESER